MVQMIGLEPTRALPHGILSPTCLPISSHLQIYTIDNNIYSTSYIKNKSKKKLILFNIWRNNTHYYTEIK